MCGVYLLQMQITLEMKIKDSKKIEKIAYPDALNAFLRGLHNK